jgi:O-antigen/teichoic acid export membrane protein
VRRAGIGILDQMLYNGSNFVLTILVARSTSTAGFGAFALLFTTWTIANSTCRGLTSETFVVRYSASKRRRWRRAVADCGGASLMLGALVGLGTIGASFLLGGTLARAALVIGIVFPGMFLQDFLRYAALAAARPLVALASDFTVTVAQFAGVGLVLYLNIDSVATLVACWGIAGCLGAVVALMLLRVFPKPQRAWAWLRDERELATKYAVDDLAANGGQQAPAYVVAAVSGLSGVGALRGAQSVFGPPSIFNLGINAAVTPELVRVLRRSSRLLVRYVMLVALGSCLVGALWGIGAMVVPNSFGKSLYGPTWLAAHPLLIFFTINQAANGIRVGATAGLRSLGAANRTLIARLVSIISAVVLATAGAVVDGARGVAIGIMTSTLVAATMYWWQFMLGIKDHRLHRSRQRMQDTWDAMVAESPDAERGLLQRWNDASVRRPDDDDDDDEDDEEPVSVGGRGGRRRAGGRARRRG